MSQPYPGSDPSSADLPPSPNPYASEPASGQQQFPQQPGYPQYGTGQQSGYPQPGAYNANPYGVSTSKNSLGLWAMILSISGLFLTGLVGAIVGIVLGKQGVRAADQGLADNRGQAQAGVTVGWIAVALNIIGIIIVGIVIVVAVSSGTTTDSESLGALLAV